MTVATAGCSTRGGLVLFDAICVPQCVQSMFTVTMRRRHTRHHTRAGLLADKGILQHLSELGATEWGVAVLALKAADHLLEGQQGGVDLRPFHACLLGVVRGVGAALAACQVDKAQLPANLACK